MNIAVTRRGHPFAALHYLLRRGSLRAVFRGTRTVALVSCPLQKNRKGHATGTYGASQLRWTGRLHSPTNRTMPNNF